MNIYISGPIKNYDDWEKNFDSTEEFIRQSNIIPTLFNENNFVIFSPKKINEQIAQTPEKESLIKSITSLIKLFGDEPKNLGEDSIGLTISLLAVNHWADVIYVSDAQQTNISLGMVAEGSVARRRGVIFLVEKREKKETFEKLLKIARSNAQILGTDMAIILNTETGLLELVKYTDHPIINDSVIYIARPEAAEVEDVIYKPFVATKLDKPKFIYVVLRLED